MLRLLILALELAVMAGTERWQILGAGRVIACLTQSWKRLLLVLCEHMLCLFPTH